MIVIAFGIDDFLPPAAKEYFFEELLSLAILLAMILCFQVLFPHSYDTWVHAIFIFYNN
jgi:hypothetical protein